MSFADRAKIFLPSMFFAFVLISGTAHAQISVLEYHDGQNATLNVGSSSILLQPLDHSVEGSIITSFEMGIECQNISVSNPEEFFTYGILKINSSKYVESIISRNVISITTPSYIRHNFSLPQAVKLEVLTSGSRYAVFINTSNPTDCGLVSQYRVNNTDSLISEDFSRSIGGNPLDSYEGKSAVSLAGSGDTIDLTVFGFQQFEEFNSSVSSTFTSSFGGEGYNITTPESSFPSDCLDLSFSVNLTHSGVLFNGTSPSTQTFISVSKLIKPSTATTSNTTIFDWSNQSEFNFTLNFQKTTGYHQSSMVQGLCSGSMGENTTFVSSECNLDISCIRIISGNETVIPVNIIDSPFTPITDGDTVELTNQIIGIFLTPFMLFMIIAFVLAGSVTLAIGEGIKGNASLVFVSVLFIISVAYVVIGIFPLFVGIIIVLGLALLLAKMIMGFFT